MFVQTCVLASGESSEAKRLAFDRPDIALVMRRIISQEVIICWIIDIVFYGKALGLKGFVASRGARHCMQRPSYNLPEV